MLARCGFKWRRHQTTDTVDAKYIACVTGDGATIKVAYKDTSALIETTAVVESIDVPSDPDRQWIFVNWESISDRPRNKENVP